MNSKFVPTEPFNVPSLPPRHETESLVILKKLTPAARSLSALNQVARLLVDQNLLINLIPILESKSSSEIENIVTTTDELFRYAGDEGNATPAVKETLRYKQAMLTGFSRITDDGSRPLCTNTAISICSALTQTQVDVRKVTGTNLKNTRTAEVIYTPPVGMSVITEKLANWERYLHENDVDPLVAVAVMHYQFEAIHPFLDGNGRTGRILNILFLVEKQLLTQPILYLSKFIVENKEEYYRLLLGITQHQDWESWICFMLDAIRITSDWTIDKVNAVVRLQKETAEYVKVQAKTTYSHEMIALLFQNPYVRSRNLTEAGLFKSRQAAMNNLRKLEELGVLESREAGKEVLFLHKRLHFLMANDVNDYEPLGE